MKVEFLLALLFVCCASAHADSIPLKPEGGTFVVNVLINEKIPLDFTIDSGAADVTIPTDVFSTLTRTGTVRSEDLMEPAEYQMADGSKRSFQRFRIRSLQIGSHTLRDVVGLVTPLESRPLLGQSFLSRLGSWSIDNEAGLLVINGGAAPKVVATKKVGASQPSSADQTVSDRWILISKSAEEKAAGYLDLQSVKILGHTRIAWIRADYSVHNNKGEGEHANRWIKQTLAYWEFDCASQTLKEHERWVYFDDGVTWHGGSDVFSGEWEPIVPDSLPERVLDWLCAYSPDSNQ